MLKKLLSKKIAKLAGGGIGAILAAIGGITSVQVLQPAVEKASDYAAATVQLYCGLPTVDRARFRSEVQERLAAEAFDAEVSVTCPQDR